MAYLDIIPLADAKVELRVDSGHTADDASITRKIKAALEYIESETNILLVQQPLKEYVITDNCVVVYDTPINSVVKGLDDEGADVTLTWETNYDYELKHLYTNYYNIDSDAIKLVLDVGYTDPANIPNELLEVAYELIDLMYYQHETGKTIEKDLSELSKRTLSKYKRFWL